MGGVDTKLVYTWLKTKARQGKCPSCGARFFYEDEPPTKTVRVGTTEHTIPRSLPNFEIDDELVSIPTSGTRYDGTPAKIDLVTVRCNKCGYVLAFDARIIGVIK